MRKTLVGLVMAALAVQASAQDGWVRYEAEDYGFSMLMPEGTRFVEKEFGDGWAELWAESEGVKFYALTKRGEQATPEEIERVGVKLTGIPADYWEQINEGENEAGWIWYRTVEASRNGVLVLGDYGTGRTGSYLLILQTTESDYAAYESDYETWYKSIRLK
jgi:hypothetical protein